MRGLQSALTLLGFGACLLNAASASASGRIGALVPQIKPQAAPEVRDRFHEAVTRGLQSGGDEVVAAAEVRLRLGATEEMLNCAGSGGCVARAAQALRVERVVTTDIDVSGKDYTVRMRLLDAVGRELAKADEPCDICTLKEADEAVARAASKLAAAARALPGDAPPSSSTPSTVENPPPPPKSETVPMKAEPMPPKVDNPAVNPSEPAPLVRREKKAFPWRPVAIASLAVGLVGVVVGIPLLAIDGQPTCNSPNPRMSCPEVYNTVGGGAAMLTVGLAGVAASGALFYFDHRARKARPTVMLTPTQGGVYLSAGGHF
ncbi:MAG: hypothetical protein JWN44_1643 [Myxococcales bacterium]|nr:hypothetical protein [Myxococcales bacterium]